MVDSGAYISAIVQNESHTKNKGPEQHPQNRQPTQFSETSSNGQIQKPLAPVTIKLDIGDYTFGDHFVVMKNKTGALKELHFMKTRNVVIDMVDGLIHFPYLTIQVRTTSKKVATPQVFLGDAALTIPPRATKTITAFNDHPPEWNTTGTVTTLEKCTETASLLISYSKSSTIHRKMAVIVTDTTKTPYLIKWNRQIAEFSVVTPEPAKFIKPVDTAIFGMIP